MQQEEWPLLRKAIAQRDKIEGRKRFPGKMTSM